MGSAPGHPRRSADEALPGAAAPEARISEVRAGTWVTSAVRLERPLGEGGMGSVWVAHHETLDAEVAVKFISQRLEGRPEVALKRFEREARIAAKLKHPHVIQVFDHGVTDDGVAYIVMEKLEGETLAARLRREGRLSAVDTELLVSQVARVLTTAHEAGVVHRDLKPDNVFLLESDYELFVKVLDFGIAKQTGMQALGELTHTGMLVGTPHYMSPEMLLGDKDVDPRADLWGLAVMTYHALTGQLPFRGETIAALGVRVNEGSFTPPSALVDEVSPEIDAWFKIALGRKIEQRYQSAREMARGLRDALHLSRDSLNGAATDMPPSRTISTSGERLRSRVQTDEEAATVRAPEPELDPAEAQTIELQDGSQDDETAEAPMAPFESQPTTQVTLDSGAGDELRGAESAHPAVEARARWWPVVLLAGMAGAASLWGLSGGEDGRAGETAASAQPADPVASAPSTARTAAAPGTAVASAEVGAPPEPAAATVAQPAAPPAAPPTAQPVVAKPQRTSTPPRPSAKASAAPATSAEPAAGGVDCSYPFAVGKAGELIPIRECFP